MNKGSGGFRNHPGPDGNVMTPSKDQQVKEVVIGMALGVLAQNVEAVASNKMALEFAFNHAWRSWSKAREFPSIRGHDPGNLFWIGIGKSERRRGVCAAWERGRWSEPYITYEDWTVEEALDLHADDQVTADDWIELGRLFVEYFKPEEVRSTPGGPSTPARLVGIVAAMTPVCAPLGV